MNDSDYIALNNLVKLRTAIDLLWEIIPEIEQPKEIESIRTARMLLRVIENKLAKRIEVEID